MNNRRIKISRINLMIVALLLIIITSGVVSCTNKKEEGVNITDEKNTNDSDVINTNNYDVTSADNTYALSSEVSQTMQEGESNNIQNHDAGYYLNSTESVEFQETVWKFAKAYFSSNQEEIKLYLAEGIEPEVCEKNIFNDLNRFVLKWNPQELSTEKIMDVQYEFLINSDDSCSYLGIVLEYQNDKWVVQDYYLEK